jgi:arsenate reductase-like glutaredoxin family protein
LDLFGKNGIEMGTHDYSNMPPQWEKLQEILDSKP